MLRRAPAKTVRLEGPHGVNPLSSAGCQCLSSEYFNIPVVAPGWSSVEMLMHSMCGVLGITHIHRQTDRHTHTQTQTHRHTDTHTDTHTLSHTYRHTHTHRHTDTNTDTHTLSHTHTHRHTHTHTHTRPAAIKFIRVRGSLFH
jgi:hypothetical protein